MPEVLERAITGVADRVAIDWDALDREVVDDEDRELLKCLRILGAVGNLHRTLEVDTAESDWPTVPATPRARDEAVDTWGRYRLNQIVGEGGFGRVYRAWDPELQFDVALKVLRTPVADAHVREALLREGRALAKVRHPNVVSVFGVEARGDHIGLCMEFVEGETLERLLERNGTMNARQAAIVCQDVCRALAAVHLAGYVHRDVKARNVMQDRSGRIVLMDFGAGQEAQLTLTNKGNTVGTPLYMAPEVLAGESATPTSDVYSVGVLLYHLVTNEYPVEGRTLDDLRSAHMLGRRRLLSERRPDLPVPFLVVVDRALSPDPTRRYRNAAQFLDALVKVLDDRKLRPHPVVVTTSMWTAFSFAISIVVLTLAGAVTSREFNLVLGRSDFAAESWGDWLRFGGMSFLTPVVTTLLALIAAGLLAVARRFALNVSPPARRLDEQLRSAFRRQADRLHLSDRQTIASICLLAAVATIGFGWWRYQALLGALFTYASDAPASTLTLLAPSHRELQLDYRKAFIAISVVAALAWIAIGKLLPRRADFFQRGLWFGAAAVLALSLFYLSFPYRVLTLTEFPVVSWHDERCYQIGERADAWLLFCPSRGTGRTVGIPKATESIQLTGVVESIFTSF